MGKVLIFGHKNPDTDSITSSLVLANLEKKLGNYEVEACRQGNINKETEFVLNYLKIEAPKLIEDVDDGAEVMLVDHANTKESVPNLENAKILKIIDHHMVALNTSYPVYYRAEPVGCTETIMYKIYKENNIEIDKTIATLMVSAIISDTLLFKSPTCTKEDVKIAEELAKIAEIDLENAMNKSIEENSLDIFMFVITDIVNSTSKAIVLGNSAHIAEKAYNEKIENNIIELKGVVSRKKQIVPVMTENA